MLSVEKKKKEEKQKQHREQIDSHLEQDGQVKTETRLNVFVIVHVCSVGICMQLWNWCAVVECVLAAGVQHLCSDSSQKI